MKLNGKKLSESNIEFCVIPRTDGEDIVFHAAAVVDMGNFDSMCPRPEPPQRLMKGGKRVLDYESPRYIAETEGYSAKRMSYMIVKSLSATPELEWESVDLGDPDTWENYSLELKESGFTDIEIMRITNCVFTANCLNEAKLEKARENFLALRDQKSQESTTLKDEQLATPSGEPVNGSV